MIKEFVCPNGRMSKNGVCPIFEGSDGQIKDMQEPKGTFKFDFEFPTESFKESAGNIISNNLNAYNSYVENNLGIPSTVSNLFTIGSALTTGSLLPFATKFVTGAFLNNQNQRRVQQITDRDTQGDITTFDMGNRGNPTPYDGGSGGLHSGMSSPATKTNQGVTSSQHSAFRM